MKKIWIDYVRVLATFAVIAAHASGGYYNEFGRIELSEWWFANIVDSFSRFCVPIFIMISGCVLLGRNTDIRGFYWKRGKRLIPALIFWSLFYIAFDHLYDGGTNITLEWRFKSVILSGYAHLHLWYLSMFICLMLFVPFINDYIIGRKPTMEYFVWMLALFLTFMTLNLLSSISYNIFHESMGWFKIFPWFICYLIMGYFVDVYRDKIPIKNGLTLAILVITMPITAILNFYSAKNFGIVQDYFILDNTGVANFIITMAIFHCFSVNRNIFKENRLISSVASYSFGIYLIHPAILGLVNRKLNFYLHDIEMRIILSAAITFAVSYLMVSIVARVRWLNAVI